MSDKGDPLSSGRSLSKPAGSIPQYGLGTSIARKAYTLMLGIPFMHQITMYDIYSPCLKLSLKVQLPVHLALALEVYSWLGTATPVMAGGGCQQRQRILGHRFITFHDPKATMLTSEVYMMIQDLA